MESILVMQAAALTIWCPLISPFFISMAKNSAVRPTNHCNDKNNIDSHISWQHKFSKGCRNFSELPLISHVYHYTGWREKREDWSVTSHVTPLANTTWLKQHWSWTRGLSHIRRQTSNVATTKTTRQLFRPQRLEPFKGMTFWAAAKDRI